jgi:hypothetical protein
MKKNMGSVDKLLRLGLAIFFVVLYLTKVITGTWGVVILLIALTFVVTSLFSFCPLYWPFGINTKNCCKDKEALKS